jgi:gamma-glutamylcyclotransferase (GGCT)/AIG2-like uncharacterized protein YtfP
MNHLLLLDRVRTRPEKFRLRFPVGVFGTLRRGQANAALMAGYTSCRRGFLPHFVAQGFRLRHRRGAAAPFEVYEFAEADWPAALARLDALEEFTPEAEAAWDYHRTLMGVTLLPEGFAHPLFDAPELITPASSERDLAIPEGEWGEMGRVACWVYSSPGENARSIEFGDSPVLWW